MPTIKQKRAAKLVVENGGNVSKAMRDAGYSEATAKTPQKLTESDGWNALLEEYFPDEMLNSRLKEGLDANKIHGTDNNFIEIPDAAVRHKYIDTILKLKNKYPAEKKVLAGDKDEPLFVEIVEEKK